MVHQFIPVGGEQLFSVYHEPEVMDHCDAGIVFCYPYGQEYIRCHRLHVNIANKLAKRGFHVLRFDYYGTGDSTGEFSSLTVKESLNNIKMVVDRFRTSCDLHRVILLGVRFGATLAIMYSKIYDIDALVLWDPVLDGRAYIKSIDMSYKKWLNGSFTKEHRKRNSFMENFGFQFSANLVNEIEEISISKEKLTDAIPTLVLGENKKYWIKLENEDDKALVPAYETDITVEWLDKLIF